MPILLIAIGGAAGAVARYAMDVTIATRLDGAFPWGTFAVNLSGSFALGLSRSRSLGLIAASSSQGSSRRNTGVGPAGGGGERAARFPAKG